jgi:hypothetical protein
MEYTQSLFPFPQLMKRWCVSRDLLARAAKRGQLRTVYIGGRRMVPRAEVERIELVGLGLGRQYTKRAKATQ